MASEAAESLPADPPSTSLAALWIAFLVSIFVVAGIDFCCINGSGRCACMPTYGKQILLWVLAGLGFAAFVMQVMGAAAAGSWMYGYFLEYMLSIDNLFVFQLVFKGYSTPECHVDRALFWGIAAAVLLRLGFFWHWHRNPAAWAGGEDLLWPAPHGLWMEGVFRFGRGG
mmetsp:Transcript_8694/g.18729  ORF Transcript_8694/g.18729 Transcript_8694/m.18729 type:complete len:170 (-) Transcript_8694:853-1362(-)